MSSSRKSRRCGQIHKAVFHGFFEKRSQKIPNDGIILKEKFLEFMKKLDIKEFKASSNCWLDKTKKRYKCNNRLLFAFFCTILNIFTKNFHHFS